MMAKIIRVDHVAILTPTLSESVGFWRDALGLELTQIVDVPAENSQVAFLPVGGSEIELVAPTDMTTGLGRYLQKKGPGMHHVCLEVDDIEGMLAQLKEKGIQLIHEQPVTAASGRRYAFIHPKSAGGVLVELYE
jgi:methylmalonyl-CoA/ethylmalonyl-CoA epimerase